MTDKNKIRQDLISARHAIADHVRTEWNIAIGQQLLKWLDLHPATILGVYWPIRNEPDLRTIYPELAMRGIQLALPAVIDKQSPLKFLQWKLEDALMPDAMGIPTPDISGLEVKPDTILVPCVGFNAEMIRLGYGGGFYDRTLARPGRPVAIGIAYECSRTSFAAAPHDVAFDAVVTEKTIEEN
jgi:5-formyltetrahydrofolate cyclo-ligase